MKNYKQKKKSRLIIFFLSSTGNDNNPGTRQNPFASLEKARNTVRQVQKSGFNGNIHVNIRGGVYHLKKTVVFNLQDSARDRNTITYKAYKNEKPVFTSGKKIINWNPLNKNIDALPKQSQGKIQVADIPEVKNNKWIFHTLYHKENSLPRARSKGFKPLDQPVSYKERWKYLNTLHFPKGKIKNWDNLNDVEIVVRPNHVWILNYLPLSSVNTKTQTAKTTIPATYRPVQVRPKSDASSCWVENVLEALDAPGKWVLNSKEGQLYFWPKNKAQLNNIYAPVLNELIRIEGENCESLKGDKPVKGLIFKGITFTCCNRDVWKKEDKGIQHDWDMYDKDNALFRLRGASDCILSACTFRNSGSSGIRLDLFSQNIQIKNCHIYNLGGTGILLCGYGPGKKDVNKNHLIYNNHIHHIARLYHHCPAIFIWQSANNRILNNYIHDLPYDAIVLSGVRPRFFSITDPVKWNFKDVIPKNLRENMRVIRHHEVGHPKTAKQVFKFAHSRNNLVQDNEIYNVMEMFGDGNAIYFSCAGSGNVIKRNLIYHSLRAIADLRFDDDQVDAIITQNIIFGNGIHLKHRNTITNNIIIGGGILFEPETEHGCKVKKNIFFSIPAKRKNMAEFYGKVPYQKRGPLEKELFAMASPDRNLFFSPSKNAAEFIKKIKNIGYEKNGICSDPLFINLQKGDTRLRKNSPARKIGIKSVDITKIGLKHDPAYLRLKKWGFKKFYGKICLFIYYLFVFIIIP